MGFSKLTYISNTTTKRANAAKISTEKLCNAPRIIPDGQKSYVMLLE